METLMLPSEAMENIHHQKCQFQTREQKPNISNITEVLSDTQMRTILLCIHFF